MTNDGRVASQSGKAASFVKGQPARPLKGDERSRRPPRRPVRAEPPPPSLIDFVCDNRARATYNTAMSSLPDATESTPAPTRPRRRRWFLYVVVLLLAGVYLYASRSKPSAVAWMDDLQAAQAKAAEKNQLTLLAFDGAWCGYCKAMDREVFSREDVADALADWVPVKIDIDKHAAIAMRYNVQGTPAFIALSPAGRAVSTLPGAVPAETFIQWILSVESRWSGLGAGRAREAEKNQLVLMAFYDRGHEPCEKMDREVLPRQDVANALANWELVKIDGKENRALAVQYGAHRYPTFIALSPAGEVVGRLVGARPAEAFVQWIQSVEFWLYDLDAGLARAVERNQLVLIDFHARWCSPCYVMDKEVFARKEVAQAMANWVPVKIDGDTHRAIVARYGVDSYPTFIAVSPKGEVVRRLAGFIPAETFIEWIQLAEKHWTEVNKPS